MIGPDFPGQSRQNPLRGPLHEPLERFDLVSPPEGLVCLHGLGKIEPVGGEAQGSIRPVLIRRRRVGILNVSTNPVVLVTSRIHRDSRCKVAGLP